MAELQVHSSVPARWRIVFAADETSVTVTDIRSGYGAEELAPGAPDKYQDKELHRAFLREFHYSR